MSLGRSAAVRLLLPAPGLESGAEFATVLERGRRVSPGRTLPPSHAPVRENSVEGRAGGLMDWASVEVAEDPG